MLPDRSQGELYYAFVKTHAHGLDHVKTDLSAALERAGTVHEVQVFRGKKHGFQYTECHVYAPVAAAEARDWLYALRERRLK